MTDRDIYFSTLCSSFLDPSSIAAYSLSRVYGSFSRFFRSIRKDQQPSERPKFAFRLYSLSFA